MVYLIFERNIFLRGNVLLFYHLSYQTRHVSSPANIQIFFLAHERTNPLSPLSFVFPISSQDATDGEATSISKNARYIR